MNQKKAKQLRQWCRMMGLDAKEYSKTAKILYRENKDTFDEKLRQVKEARNQGPVQ